MSGKSESEGNVVYTCPNHCADLSFYQDGVVNVRRLLTEVGEKIEDNCSDFIPQGPVKCRKCGAEARIGKRVEIVKRY